MPDEVREITWRIRACPPSRTLPDGAPEEQATAGYLPWELDVMAEQRALLDGPGRDAAMNTIDFLHEAKALLDAVMDPPRQPPPRVVVPAAVLGGALRDLSMAQVEAAADPAVKAEAARAIAVCAAAAPELTSDDVWLRMKLKPEEPRMLGPVMRNAAREGLIERLDRTVLSTLPQNHRRPIRVWRSLVHDEQQTLESSRLET